MAPLDSPYHVVGSAPCACEHGLLQQLVCLLEEAATELGVQNHANDLKQLLCKEMLQETMNSQARHSRWQAITGSDMVYQNTSNSIRTFRLLTDSFGQLISKLMIDCAMASACCCILSRWPRIR